LTGNHAANKREMGSRGDGTMRIVKGSDQKVVGYP